MTMLRRNMLMRIGLAAALAFSCALAPVLAQVVYRHVDERGRVTFSDVPPDKTARRLKQAAPNVGSKDAVNQLDMAKRERQQQDAEERSAAQRRAAAAQPPPPPPRPPLIIPGRRGGYDSTQPPAQAASDSSRRY